ncbi:hypothetical protein E4O03_13080 [Treponema sp. OMZ 792]|uniref:hypothetical protein n=1 Tax=unclassified Treponema TaxID=2638727 RepID=UPI0020A3E54E|nr:MULTISPECIES: hypothetical protein [unclassified Treponema]UTC75089.1 hypothetical protein E4O03_13080 [Treponema sp. OMZ 792]UTC81485.1 hypothetical protein E4O07_12995 [Treponema sp. OMZ 798]
MKTKTLYRQSVFPCEIDRVYSLLKNLSTLQCIAIPYATFEPQTKSDDIEWYPGQTITFRFKIFGIIPYGIHTINVIEFSKEGIYTNESNTHVPMWNHRIQLIDNKDGTTTYSDEVEIGAGWKTIFVWMWAKCFYAHRQKKWIRLLER